MNISTPQLVLWIALMAGEGAVLASIAYSRQWRQFPNFGLYISFCLLRSVTLFIVCRTLDSSVYPWVYFVGMAMQSVALLACFTELLKSMFISSRHVPKLGCTFAVLAVLCVAASLIDKPGAYSDFVTAVVHSLDRGVSWFVLAAFMAVVLSSRRIGIPWRKRSFRIACGFFLCVSAYTLTSSIVTSFPELTSRMRYVDMVSFLVSEVIWSVAYLLPDTRLHVITPEQMRQVHASITRVNTTSGVLTPLPQSGQTSGEQKTKVGARG